MIRPGTQFGGEILHAFASPKVWCFVREKWRFIFQDKIFLCEVLTPVLIEFHRTKSWSDQYLAWHNLFCKQTCFLPNQVNQELAKFWAWLPRHLRTGVFKADPKSMVTENSNFAIWNLSKRILILICGVQLCGEIEEGNLLGSLNYILSLTEKQDSSHALLRKMWARTEILRFSLGFLGRKNIHFQLDS